MRKEKTLSDLEAKKRLAWEYIGQLLKECGQEMRENRSAWLTIFDNSGEKLRATCFVSELLDNNCRLIPTINKLWEETAKDLKKASMPDEEKKRLIAQRKTNPREEPDTLEKFVEAMKTWAVLYADMQSTIACYEDAAARRAEEEFYVGFQKFGCGASILSDL